MLDGMPGQAVLYMDMLHYIIKLKHFSSENAALYSIKAYTCIWKHTCCRLAVFEANLLISLSLATGVWYICCPLLAIGTKTLHSPPKKLCPFPLLFMINTYSVQAYNSENCPLLFIQVLHARTPCMPIG